MLYVYYATSSSSPGIYDITVTGAAAQNYSFNYVKGTLTITEESKISFTLQGITYLLTPSTQTAEVQSVNNSLMKVEIPSSVSYNGRTYQVTSINDGVFQYGQRN